MDTTTIKIHEDTKYSLDQLGTENETYDDIIARLIVENKKKNLVRELIAGYKANEKEDKKLAQEWDIISAEIE